jgi:hypothetical protein
MYSTWRWHPDIVPFVSGCCLIWRTVLASDIPVPHKQWVGMLIWQEKVFAARQIYASVMCVHNMRPSTVVFLQWICHLYFSADGLPMRCLSLGFTSDAQILSNVVSSRLVLMCSVLCWPSPIACDMFKALRPSLYCLKQWNLQLPWTSLLMIIEKSVLGMTYVLYFWHQIHMYLAWNTYCSGLGYV